VVISATWLACGRQGIWRQTRKGRRAWIRGTFVSKIAIAFDREKTASHSKRLPSQGLLVQLCKISHPAVLDCSKGSRMAAYIPAQNGIDSLPQALSYTLVQPTLMSAVTRTPRKGFKSTSDSNHGEPALLTGRPSQRRRPTLNRANV
jgi:hypothetical protein